MRAPCWKQSTGYIPGDLQARHVKYAPPPQKRYGSRLSRHIWFAIERGSTIQAKVLSTKEKASPFIQGGLEIPICVKIVWADTVSTEKLKTKVVSLGYKIDVDYVDDSKDILKGILAGYMEKSDEEIEVKEVVEQDNTVVIL